MRSAHEYIKTHNITTKHPQTSFMWHPKTKTTFKTQTPPMATKQ